jgi:hypothetical protein
MMDVVRLVSLVALVACGSATPSSPSNHASDVGRCGDAPLVPVAELARHDGQRIAFDAIPVEDHTQTIMGCGPDYPCCNHVGGGYLVLIRDRFRIMLESEAIRCGGNECNWTCEPFGNHPTAPVRFVGVLQIDSSDTPMPFTTGRLAVEKFCR